MSKNKSESDLFHSRSLGLGIVMGLTVTAAIVTIQSFIGLTDTKIANAYNFAELRYLFRTNLEQEMNGKHNNDYPYFSAAEISEVVMTDWNDYSNTEFGFALKYPENWTESESGLIDCRQDAATAECFMAEFTDSDKKTSIIVTTSDTYLPSEKVSRFPVVGLIQGNEVIAGQFRKTDCTATTQGQNCTADPAGSISYTIYPLGDTGLNVVVAGPFNLDAAAVVNSILTL